MSNSNITRYTLYPTLVKQAHHPSSLVEIAKKVAVDSTIKHEPANRRVRALRNGKWLFDTLKALYVWEHQYCKSTPPERLS